MPLPKGRSPNYFAQPVAKAYNPTLRDKAVGLLSGLFGDTYQTNLFSRGLLGSSGLGGGQGPIAGMGLLDMTPLGAAFALEEAGRKIGRGDRVGGVADAALAVVPIPAAARGAKRVARRVAPKAAKAAPRPGFTAYHGSPHTFDQFDTAKIGTGEGAQAYGHGLYFAENEGVARSYRDALKWKGTDWTDPEFVASFWTQNRGGPEKARAWLQAAANSAKRNPGSHPDAAANKAVEDAIALLDNGFTGERQSANPGSMYQVRINADPNDFLDWDRPLGAQSPNVQRALAPSYRIEPAGDAHAVIVESRFGDVPGPVYSSRDAADSYVDYAKRGSHPASEVEALVRKAARTQEGASALREAGIPGIRYLDQGSRGAGEGSRNFVVFDPRIIDIMKRYGVAAPVAAAILAGTMQPPKGREPGA